MSGGSESEKITTFGRFWCHVPGVVTLNLLTFREFYVPRNTWSSTNLGSPNFQLPLQASVVVPWCWPSSIEILRSVSSFQVLKVVSKAVWTKSNHQPTTNQPNQPSTNSDHSNHWNTVVTSWDPKKTARPVPPPWPEAGTSHFQRWLMFIQYWMLKCSNVTFQKMAVVVQLLGKHNSIDALPKDIYL